MGDDGKTTMTPDDDAQRHLGHAQADHVVEHASHGHARHAVGLAPFSLGGGGGRIPEVLQRAPDGEQRLACLPLALFRRRRLSGALPAVTIPEGVTSIGVCAFEACTALITVTLPASLNSIGGYAVAG